MVCSPQSLPTSEFPFPTCNTRKLAPKPDLASNLEEATEFLLRGWALYEDKLPTTVYLDIFINEEFVARIPSGTFRSDLDAMFGDGYHAFFFNPFDFLSLPENIVEIRESSSNKRIVDGIRVVGTQFATNRQAYRKARIRSQLRWREPGPHGTPSGETAFLKRAVLAAHFHPGLRVLEVGAGEGELLHRLLIRRKQFSSYVGLDLFRAAVEKLHSRFGSDRIRFLTADAARFPFNSDVDLVLASSVCDSMFPSFAPLLKNVSRILPAGGLFLFDLLIQDNRISISRAEWEGDRFLRLYSQAEVRRLLAEAEMEMLHAEVFEKNSGEHRVFISALKVAQPFKNKFAAL